MSPIMLSALTLIAASVSPGADHVHQTRIEHQGNPVAVAYRADTDLTTRKIGLSAGTRMSTERCLWKARVSVVREASRPGSAAIRHRLDADKVLRGSHPGSCTLAKRQIAKDVARRDGDIRAHLARVAADDRAQLISDLDAIQKFAAN